MQNPSKIFMVICIFVTRARPKRRNILTLCKQKHKIKSAGRDRGLFFPYNSHIDAQLLKSNEVKVGTFLFVVAKSINK